MNTSNTCYLENSGFYEGYNRSISLAVKGPMLLLLSCYVVFGARALALESFFVGIYDYLSALCVILLLTYLMTSADSAVLVINTIASGGRARSHSNKHIVVWGAIIAGIIIALLVAGGLEAVVIDEEK